MKRLDHYWYSVNPVALLLLPLAALFCALALLRRAAYRFGWLRSVRLPVPVVVVGNITVGGSGKTPLVIWLAHFLRAQGYRPGIISRGYGGLAAQWPQPVAADADPRLVGDEPVLIAQRSGCPMAVGPDRVAAGRLLLQQHDCDIILSDDGLQHYRLARDVEIAVLDGTRRLGNGFCLPAGPLREPAWRLAGIDLRVGNGAAAAGELLMTLQPQAVLHLRDGTAQPLESFRGRRVHAVAGIGNPARFFQMLRDHGITVIEHAFPDHYRYSVADVQFGDGLPVLMTEKDGVKCRAYGDEHLWAVAVSAQLPDDFGRQLLSLLAR
ncbi:MAG: tetraacyldisaccharide 4'-kinase [Thiohalomonadaceae bacterium]